MYIHNRNTTIVILIPMKLFWSNIASDKIEWKKDVRAIGQ